MERLSRRAAVCRAQRRVAYRATAPCFRIGLTATCDRNHGSKFNCQAEWRQRCGMPVLVIAVVFFLIFLVMGVMGITAMVAEHRGKLFSGKWSDVPKPAKQ